MALKQRTISPGFLVMLGLIVLGLEQLNPQQSIPALIVGGALLITGLVGVVLRR